MQYRGASWGLWNRLVGRDAECCSYVFIQPFLESRFETVDTCGVHSLHGMPGLLGELIAIMVVPNIALPQLMGIAATVALGLGGGLIAGALIRLTGTTHVAYEHGEEFAHVDPPAKPVLSQEKEIPKEVPQT